MQRYRTVNLGHFMQLRNSINGLRDYHTCHTCFNPTIIRSQLSADLCSVNSMQFQLVSRHSTIVCGWTRRRISLNKKKRSNRLSDGDTNVKLDKFYVRWSTTLRPCIPPSLSQYDRTIIQSRIYWKKILLESFECNVTIASFDETTFAFVNPTVDDRGVRW